MRRLWSLVFSWRGRAKYLHLLSSVSLACGYLYLTLFSLIISLPGILLNGEGLPSLSVRFLFRNVVMTLILGIFLFCFCEWAYVGILRARFYRPFLRLAMGPPPSCVAGAPSISLFSDLSSFYGLSGSGSCLKAWARSPASALAKRVPRSPVSLFNLFLLNFRSESLFRPLCLRFYPLLPRLFHSTLHGLVPPAFGTEGGYATPDASYLRLC